MDKYKYSLQTKLSDLNLYQCGMQTCAPGHANGPVVMPYYLLHFIISGKGYFETNGCSYRLTSGNAFLISPNRLSYYHADKNDPWVYCWIALDGIKAKEYFKQAGLSAKKPIYSPKNPVPVREALIKIVDDARGGKDSELHLMGLLYLFLDELCKQADKRPQPYSSPQEEYLQKIVRYIYINIWDKVTVTDLAAYAGLDRSYLYKIFKQALKVSPQEFILRAKLEHACSLLASTDTAVGTIARSVGYQDPLAFSKIFKKRYGISPKEYRLRGQKEAIKPKGTAL